MTSNTKKKSDWYVYLLHDGKRTYVGSTTCVVRRLRQHNGEIKGGARATRKSRGSWKIVCYLKGFQNRSEACRWEALVKKRARGLSPRIEAMRLVAVGKCPAGRVEYTVPLNIELSYGNTET
jgi:predicted GIY-YIG superfamily endonuclease